MIIEYIKNGIYVMKTGRGKNNDKSIRFILVVELTGDFKDKPIFKIITKNGIGKRKSSFYNTGSCNVQYLCQIKHPITSKELNNKFSHIINN